ncbi:ubiquitin-conjugating enzyme/RWD-like protein [Aspergillus unguis]
MAQSRSLRRLMKEAAELSSSPSPHFHAAPTTDSNLFDWHFTLAGPPETPYAGGIYHGRIVLPPTYPLRPPSFRFLTPSGRFEVNREICLSISGHHEEMWQPAWGIRTALIAIRSFMEGDARGQVGGLEGVSDEIRKRWAQASRSWRCESCGKSNEEVLREWRVTCIERGVDVEKEEEVEGVPEGLRIGVGKKGTDTDTDKEQGREQDEVKAQAKDVDGNVGDGLTEGSELESAVNAGDSGSVPSASDGSKPTSVPTPASRSLQSTTPAASVPSSQPRPTPTRTTQPVPSQDSPWLDRAIFGVLVALILMILRRVINVED